MTFLDKIKDNYQDWIRITPKNSLYDRGLFWLFIILLLVGVVAVSSASVAEVDKNPFFYTKRDLSYFLLSVITFFVLLKVHTETWKKYHVYMFWIALFLLIIVLIPGIGSKVNGSRRWINLIYFNFQPAEFAKLALTCFLAGYFTRRYDEVRSRKLSAFKPLLVMGTMGVLLIQQPDLGSTVVLFVITFCMLFIVGAHLFQFLALIGIGGLLFGVLVVTSEYRWKRMTSFMDPFQDYLGDGYQLSQSLMAFGRGEFFGEGLGNSIQKLGALPEPHTDFVLAIVGEEFGLIGIFVIIILLSLLIFKALTISKNALLLEQRFKGFLAFGISFWIFFQGFVNLGMALGLLPTKGLTFPLISYGGSSLIIMSMAVSILLRIDYENRQMTIGNAILRDD